MTMFRLQRLMVGRADRRAARRVVRGVVGCVVGGWALGAGPVRAQTVSTLSNLSFGTLIAGTTSSVIVTSPGAAQWQVTSTLKLLNQVTFTLPTTLTRAGGGSMTVTYCTTCAGYSFTNNPTSATLFNPNASYTITLVTFTPIYIWLGGSVSPPANQTPGTYTGSAVLTVIGLGL